MYDPFTHTNEMITHFVSDELRDVINLVVTIAISYLVGKNANKAPKWWTLGLILATLFLLFLIGSAIEAHHSRGFNNGVRFAIDSVLSLLMTLTIVYPFVSKFLPTRSKHLGWARNPKMWITYTAHGGKPETAPASNKSIRFGVHFSSDEGRWAMMEVQFKDAQNYRGWAGISFDIRSDKLYPGSTISLQIATSNGSQYLTGRPLQIHNQKAIFLFQEMCWANWSAKSSHGYLDLQQVAKVAVVCHTSLDDIEFSVFNFALIKYADVTPQVGAAT